MATQQTKYVPEIEQVEPDRWYHKSRRYHRLESF